MFIRVPAGFARRSLCCYPRKAVGCRDFGARLQRRRGFDRAVLMGLDRIEARRQAFAFRVTTC